MKTDKHGNRNPLWKIILTDMAGIGCLVLVPILGPLPGPGGIPLLLAGFGFLAINHDWADDAIHYVKKHSESLQAMIFPDKTWIKWLWDIAVLIIVIFGTVLNIYAEWWLLKGLSYGILASGTTIFMLNRGRLAWFDKLLRRSGNR